jgi:hypothetical protein
MLIKTLDKLRVLFTVLLLLLLLSIYALLRICFKSSLRILLRMYSSRNTKISLKSFSPYELKRILKRPLNPRKLRSFTNQPLGDAAAPQLRYRIDEKLF